MLFDGFTPLAVGLSESMHFLRRRGWCRKCIRLLLDSDLSRLLAIVKAIASSGNTTINWEDCPRYPACRTLTKSSVTPLIGSAFCCVVAPSRVILMFT
jgi:hypothetical protein